MKAVTPQTDLRLAIAEAKGTGATGIKIYADLPADLVAAITKEAHSQGMLVWAHATVFPATATEVVDAGVDSVSHATMLAIARPTNTYAESHVQQTQLYTDGFGPQFSHLLDEMKAHHTILDATLLVFKQSDEAHAKHPETPYVKTLPHWRASHPRRLPGRHPHLHRNRRRRRRKPRVVASARRACSASGRSRHETRRRNALRHLDRRAHPRSGKGDGHNRARQASRLGLRRRRTHSTTSNPSTQ
jgi:hypothetical protein